MTVASRVKPKLYQDSVRLMQISKQLSAAAGVGQAFVAMATGANKRVLDEVGLLTPEAEAAAANDLVIVVEAEDSGAAESALEAAEELLLAGAASETPASGEEKSPSSLGEALGHLPGANLMLISVPGAYAPLEVVRALDADLDVFLFSDNVGLEHERALKERAVEKGLLLMGPGCGTAILDGVALGFANAVARGPVGVVGASGTGMQEVTTLLDRAGVGVAQAIGVGGRDLSEEIGGLMMLQGLRKLAADPAVEVLVVVSKPPAASVRDAIFAELERGEKPAVVNFLGEAPEDGAPSSHVHRCATFEETALEAVRLVGGGDASEPLAAAGDLSGLISEERERLAPGQRYVRGLFSGGSLCDEAMVVLRESLPKIFSNIPLDPTWALDNGWQSREHSCIDMGEEEFTEGRPHPMIDLGLRQRRLLEEAADPEVALILLDVVIGYGSHEDPAGLLAETVREAKALAAEDGRHLAVVTSVCGTEGDPQGRSRQREKLEAAGALVLPTSAQAAQAAAALVNGAERQSTQSAD